MKDESQPDLMIGRACKRPFIDPSAPTVASSSLDSLSSYDYDLPKELIAQRPPAQRDDSRLFVLYRRTQRWEHRRFREIALFFRKGDVLVLNDTRVFPARLRAKRPTGGRVEVLLLECAPPGPAWLALARPLRALKPGATLFLEGGAPQEGSVTLHPLVRQEEKIVVELHREGRALEPSEVMNFCEEAGETPLPPYIRREEAERRSPADRERYQTVYAKETGAVAAPTAGLHFTQAILDDLRSAGVVITAVTLHVGPGTFQPLTEEAFQKAQLHSEEVEVSAGASQEILRAQNENRRIIAVGTTTVRALESFALSRELPFRTRTDLFIKPGHIFSCVSAMITNFHLPRSSLLCLVSAFAGRDFVLAAYREAVREGYRFYSYGDAMLILDQ